MRVCILTSAHLPFATRIFHKQAKSLLKAGHDGSFCGITLQMELGRQSSART